MSPSPGAGGATERLWLTEPRRKTALAHVTAIEGDAFALDRSLYCPRSHEYRHVQQPDHGTVWLADGSKRKLVSTFLRDGTLWHRLRGVTPAVGAELNCHLDVARRADTATAHTAMHLVLLAAARTRVPALAADPEVRGGRTARLEFEAHVAPKLLAGWLQQVASWVEADRPVTRVHVTRDEVAHHVVPQPFADDPVPGPETTLDVVRVEDVGGLPCDGTHVARTGEVGRVTFRHAHMDRGGRFVVVLHAEGP